MKDQGKTPGGKKPNKMKISNLPDKEFKAIVIEMLTELGKRIENTELQQRTKKHKKNQSELKMTITEMKNTLEKLNSRLGDTEECIIDKIVEITQPEEKRKFK